MWPILLSSYEFATYRKGNGCISIRHRSYLIVPTNAGFSLSAYMPRFEARLTLPDSSEIELDDLWYTVGTEFEYDGKAMVHRLSLGKATKRKQVAPGLAHLRIKYEFNFAGHPDALVHEH